MSLQSVMPNNGPPPDPASGESRWGLPDLLLDLVEDGSPDLMEELIVAFQTDIQTRLKQVRQALADSDLKGIRAGIHSIKGSAQQMGATAMASMCLNIELAGGDLTPVQLSQNLSGLEGEFDHICHAMAAYSIVQRR
jgi:HPt (histidine-containing phosphotransfer) domain-containing protein